MTDDYPYVYGKPGASAILLRVWHYRTGKSEKNHGTLPAPDEVQPAVMIADGTARPSDGMYDMLDMWGDEVTAEFEGVAYGQGPVVLDEVNVITLGLGADDRPIDITFQFIQDATK